MQDHQPWIRKNYTPAHKRCGIWLAVAIGIAALYLAWRGVPWNLASVAPEFRSPVQEFKMTCRPVGRSFWCRMEQ